MHLGYSLTIETNAAKVEGGERRPSLLYVGNRRGYKNFTTLLQAYGSSPILREFELIAFGGYPLPDERKEITRLGITDRCASSPGPIGSWQHATGQPPHSSIHRSTRASGFPRSKP